MNAAVAAWRTTPAHRRVQALGRKAAAGVSIEVLYSDHDHQLVVLVDDVATGRQVSRHWTENQPLE